MSAAKHQIVPASPEHVRELAGNMRAADARELWAGWRAAPLEALVRSVAVSRDPMSGIADGRVVCMFGVGGTSLSTVGVPWMLGSRDLPRYAVPFLRLSFQHTRQWLQDYATLENFVDARNSAAIRWLTWLGFSVGEALPFGPDQMPFHKFGAWHETVHHLRAA